jgi:hypothetical protein
MALTTYAELQASVASWLNRTDLTDQIKDFIALAEARFNREIRHWRMEKTASGTISARLTTLPADWLETITLTVETSDGPQRLQSINAADMLDLRHDDRNAGGTPQYVHNTAGQQEVFPSPDASYTSTLHYIEQIPALSDSNTSNWLLTYHPDAYLYTALVASAPFLGEDARTATWAALATSAVAAVNAESATSKFQAGMKMRAGSGLR